MPQFNPGEEGVAIATFPTKPAGLECTAELWLASDLNKAATSGEIPFIATGEDKSITLPIALPGVEGTYPVYLEVFSNGQRIAVFRGDEDVVIGAVAPHVFTFGTLSIAITTELVYKILQMTVVVTNNNPTSLAGKIYARYKWVNDTRPDAGTYRLWNAIAGVDQRYIVVSLAPGASRTVISPFRYYNQHGDLLSNGPYLFGNALVWFEDEFGGKSQVVGPY